jgi:hypothetical protein
LQFKPAPINSVSEKLIARYAHSGNSVAQASSVNIATGLFTTTSPMSWGVSGTIYSNMVVSYVGSTPSSLYKEWNGTNAYGIKVVSASSFYVINNSGSNAVVTYATGQTVDLTKIQFEYNLVSPPLIDLTNVKMGDSIRTTYYGIRNRPSWTSVGINLNYSGGTNQWSQTILDGRTFQIGYFEQSLKYVREHGILMGWGGKVTSQQWQGTSGWVYNSSIDPSRSFDYYNNLTFTGVQLGGGFSNGTVVEIYSTF